MKHLTFLQITKLQKAYGVSGMQESINNGQCWKMEGSAGRFAMSCLESGVCILPLQPKYDYYGNRVPSRNDLKQGTKGTFLNSVRFWNQVLVLDNIDGKMVKLTKPTNWKSVVDAKQLCRGFELGGKKLFIQLCPKIRARSRRQS